MKPNAAFTLIEMLTVIVIIGIVIAIGIPAMNNLMRSTGLQGGVRQVYNTAQLARQFAITHRVETELQVSNTWNAISVFTNGVQIDKWTYLPLGVTIEPSPKSDNSITFRPTGNLVSQNDQKIVVREGIYDTNTSTIVATSSNVATVMISAVIGRVSIATP